MDDTLRIASFNSAPTLNRALKRLISKSFFNFFVAGGAEEVLVSGAGVEPFEEGVVSLLRLR